MRLCDSFQIRPGEVVAFIGAGGKTSALVRLGHELKDDGWRVLATTTTRIAKSELSAFPYATSMKKIKSPQKLSNLLTNYGFVFLYDRIKGDKVIGVAPESIGQLTDNVDSDTILIEADGARRLPLKAPQTHEPVIPQGTTLVVPVAGMHAVGQPLNTNTVYNADRIIEHMGFPQDGTIQPGWIAQIIRDEELGLRGVPENVRINALLNDVGSSMRERIKTRRTAQLILKQNRIQAVAIGRVNKKSNPVWELQRRVGAIVLAGGLSKRMGRSKALLPWGDQTVIEAIVRRLTPLPLADLVVVTGHQAGSIRAALHGTGARIAYNRRFSSGEMISSLQVGLGALDPSISACLVVMGDQPQISPRLVNDVLITYAQGKGTIIAPEFNGQQGHPVLIDRRYWVELLDLPEGSAPRDVISAYKGETAYVKCKDDSPLRDIDTPAQYQDELRRAGLS